MNTNGILTCSAMALGLLSLLKRRDPLWLLIQALIYLRAVWLLLGKCLKAIAWEIQTQRGACLARARRD